MKEFVDASLFLGMHSTSEAVRIACKNYFVQRYEQTVGMSDDQGGKCDRVIWKYPRKIQDIYYPFMDRLRTDMDVQCLEYAEEDVNVALSDRRLKRLKTSQKLTLGMVLARGGSLYTVEAQLYELNSKLAEDKRLAIAYPQLEHEQVFPDDVLEECYRQSLALRIEAHDLGYSATAWKQNIALASLSYS